MKKQNKITTSLVLRLMWERRRRLIKTLIASILVGVMVALILPVKYRTSSVLLPQSVSDQGLGQLGNLGGLGSMVGINLSSFLEGSSGISPELYPEVVRSYPFLFDLINTPFRFEKEDTTYSFYDQMLTRPKSIGHYLKKYTIKLPYTAIDLLKGEKSTEELMIFDGADGYIKLDEDTHRLMEKIHSSITVRVDSKTGLITVVFEADDAYLAAQVTQYLVDQIKVYVIDYHTRQAQENLNFIEARHAEKKKEFEEAQKEYFSYRDSYRHVIQERRDLRYQELKDNHQITMQVYQNLAQQLEQSRISVKKETPVFSVIEPVRIPYEKSKPKRTLVVFVFLVIGFFIGTMLVLSDHIKSYFHDFKNRVFGSTI